MATEIIERSSSASGNDAPQNEKRSKNPLRRGRGNNADAGPKSLKAKFVHSPGYDAGRQGPEGGLEKTSGKEKRINRETNVSEETVKKFSNGMRQDLEKLLEMRRTRSQSEFNNFLRTTGHEYYINIFDRMVKSQPGTGKDGRQLAIDEDALDAFMHTDRGMAAVYQIRQYQLQEKAMAAAFSMTTEPGEPIDKIGEDNTYTVGKGRVLREAARSVKDWIKAPTGDVYGRDRGARLNTKGKVLAAMAGGNVAALSAGALGLIAGGGPWGGIAAIAGVNAFAAARYASQRGETMDTATSAEALKVFLGDPNAPTPEGKSPNAAAIEWVKAFHNVNPTDYEVDGNEVRKRESVVAGTAVDRKRLEADLVAEAKAVLEFQSDNNIPREYRRPMDVSWLLEGTNRRPRQGTDFEQSVMREFNANRDGIRDRKGNTLETNVIKTIDVPVMDRISISVLDASGAPVIDPATGRNRMQLVEVPRLEQATDSTGTLLNFPNGDPIMVPVTRAEQEGTAVGKDIADLQPYTLPSGEVIMVPKYSLYTDAAGNRRNYSNGRPILGIGMKVASYTDAKSTPLFNPNGTERWITNPDFDQNNVDVAANVDRWRKATEKAIGAEVSIVFQSLVDGNADYTMRTYDKITEAKAAHRSGKLVDEERKRLTKEQESISGDETILKAEANALDTYETKVGEIRGEIGKMQRERDKVLRGVSISGNPNASVAEIQKALQDALGDGGSESVSINGQSIKSINSEYEKLDSEIAERMNEFNKKYIDPLAQAVADAEGLPQTNNNEYSIKQRTLESARQRLSGARAQALQREVDLRNESRFKSRADKIEARRQILEQAQSDLIEKESTLHEQQEKLTSTETEGRDSTNVTMFEMAKARAKVEGWNATGSALQLGDLQTQSFDELVKRINKANEADPTKGWPASENAISDNRITLLHAMAEARAIRVDSVLASQSTELTDLTDPAKYGFAELDLYGLNEKEIAARIQEKISGGATVATLTEQQLRGVKTEIYRRVSARQKGLSRMLVDLDTRKTKGEETLAKLDKEGIKTPQLDAIQRAVGRYGPITEEIMDQMPQDQDVDKLFALKRDKADPDDLTKSTVDADQAYKNIMDLIFSHSRDHSVSYGGKVGTEAAFDRNQTVLSKSDLVKLMESYFGVASIGSTADAKLERMIKSVRDRGKSEFAAFFSEGVIFDHLSGKI